MAMLSLQTSGPWFFLIQANTGLPLGLNQDSL